MSGNVGATTLTVAQMPSHNHLISGQVGDNSSGSYNDTAGNANSAVNMNTGNTGGSSSHTHSLSGSATVNLAVKYLDVIVCKKN